MVKYLQTVPLDISISCQYLHQDAGKAYSKNIKDEIILEVSKATFCRQMKKMQNCLFDKKEIPYKKKRNTLYLIKNKRLQEEIGKFFVDKSSAPVSISEKTVHRVLQ